MRELSKGVSMMKKRKLFTTLLTLLLLFVFIAPTMAKASEVTNGTAQTGTLTLHKFEFSNKDNEDFKGIKGTGMLVPPGELPSGIKVLPGVVFRVTRVANEAVLVPTPAALVGEGAYMTQKTTDDDGKAEFIGLPMGRYYVEELSGPSNITTPTPAFLVDIPMMNTNLTSWNWDVHVYPKNETKYGTVELTKTVEEDPMPAGKFATFTLWKDMEPFGKGLEDVQYTIPTATFPTVAGKILVSGLPMGHYYFLETIAPVGYALDNRPVVFTIDKHSYMVNNAWVNLVEVSMDNKLIPTITKDITTVGQKLDSGGYADPVTWIIRPSIPTKIDTYTSFVITDPIDSRLDFVTGDSKLEVSVAGDPRIILTRGTDYTVTEPVVTNPPSGRPVPNNLVITFTDDGMDKLAGNTGLQIRFKTTINETAVMEAEITNTATVSYNNGFGQTGTATVPDTPKVWTGGHKFHKINDETPAIDLAGAKFKLYKVVGDTKWYFTGTAWSENILNGNVYTSNNEGLVDIKGLPAGTYFLVETQAPMNTTLELPYNLLRAPIEFKVSQTSYTAGMTNIINKMGPKIPQTGGVGTLLFSIIGLGLMGSAVMISRKKSTR